MFGFGMAYDSRVLSERHWGEVSHSSKLSKFFRKLKHFLFVCIDMRMDLKKIINLITNLFS